MTKHAVVACLDLTKYYGDVCAVESVSFDLKPGEFMALLGPSGCGKTTVLRLIAGLVRPDRGEIVVKDRLVAGPGVFVPANHRRIGLVFQDYALFPHMNVEKNIGYGLSGRAERQTRIPELLELVGLRGYEKRFPHELSGGQRQRVALARALAPRPDILLLDEPFSNLDTALRVQVREEVQRIIREAQVSTILVTHDQDEAMSLADRIGIMFEGRIVQLGSPRALYEHPVSSRVARFIGETNLVHGKAEGYTAITPLGPVPLRSAHHGTVEVLLRPEDLTLSGAAPLTGASVRRATYYGPYQHVWIRLPDGTELKVVERADRAFEAGQEVRVAVQSPALAFTTEA